MNLRFEPLDAWPNPPTKPRKAGQFRVEYKVTVAHLKSELEKLGAKSVTIAACVGRDAIRLDGQLYASAKPSMPGIIIYFESKFGPLSFACDTYTEWRDNLRAIGLTLEYLRAVERYGATKRGEQYRGYAALPPPAAGGAPNDLIELPPAAPTPESDAALLLRFAGYEITLLLRQRVENEPGFLKTVYRAAAARTHPDAGGSDADFKAVTAAYERLQK